MTLPREAWPRLKEVFEGARALASDARPAYLAAACDGDEALQREVETLLASHERASSFLETPAVLLDDTMPTKSLEGQRIGVYKISARIGTGGMGEVYRARDAKLDRDVAIKVLLPAVANDPDRLARFSREAQVLASLNHPHIAQIYGLDDTGGLRALVMELVEGPTLADRIARGALPIDEALSMARQIADALEAAHEKGIVHRDLKPANIKITPDGVVKVLDFGLAKALEPTGAASANVSQSPTITTPAMTEAGMILGTAAYMSPEQASGKPVDKRSDIWAFGCVLYEMLTGKRAFEGEGVSETLARVIEREPDWNKLPPRLSPALRTYLERCLRKDPRQRIRDIGDVRLALEGAFEAAVSETTAATTSASRGRLVWMAAFAVAAVLAAALAMSALRYLGETPQPALPETRVEIVTPATDQPTSFALSPDGRQIVFAASAEGGTRLWLRSLAATTAQPLAGTEGATAPFWSPDGRALGFFADGTLKRLDLGGGAQTLASAALPNLGGGGGTWNADGVIVFAWPPTATPSLMRVSATGGAAAAVTKLGPQQVGHVGPWFLPDGRRFLFTVLGAPDTAGIYLGALDGSPPTRLTPADSTGVYLPEGSGPSEALRGGGWLLWVRAGMLVAQRLDLAQAALMGEPVTLAEGVAVDTGRFRSAVSAASMGLVAYRTGAGSQRQLTWVDRSGTLRGTVGEPDDSLGTPRVSPDGGRVVMSRTVQGNQDLWLLDGARTSRVTFDAGVDRFPLWSPDGTRIVFNSNRTGPADLYQKLASGAGVEELVLATDQGKSATSWSADGRVLLYHSTIPPVTSDLWVVPMVGDRTPEVFLKTPFREVWGAFSPDGRWVAYMSNESGQMEIHVRPFVPPGAEGPIAGAAGGQWQVSTAGGVFPLWRPDGKELYYLNPAGAMMAAPIIVTGSTLEPGAPMVLFPTRIVGGGVDNGQGRQYDVARDGRFLINRVHEAAPITLLQNWQGGLSARETR